MTTRGTFSPNLTVIDEWKAGGDKYRLVNLGAGPDQIQIQDDSGWREESQCYQWSTVTHRIAELKKCKFEDTFKAFAKKTPKGKKLPKKVKKKSK